MTKLTEEIERTAADVCAVTGITREQFEKDGILNEGQIAALDTLHERLGTARGNDDLNVIVPKGIPGAGKRWGDLTEQESEQLSMLEVEKQMKEEEQVENRLDGQMEPVEFESSGALNSHHTQTIRFAGMLLAKDEGEYHLIYRTRAGQFVLLIDTPLEGSTHRVYGSLEELRDKNEDLDAGLLADAFETVGEPFIIDLD